MTASRTGAPIAAPSFLLFVVVWASFMTTLAAFAVRDGASAREPNGLYLLALAPILLLAAARWVGNATRLSALLLRSVVAYVLAPLPPLLAMLVQHSSAPGASGHGGIVLAIIILLPYNAVIGTVGGLVAALTAFAAMRLVRRRAA